MQLDISSFVLRVQPAVTTCAKRGQIFETERVLPILFDLDFMMDDRRWNQLIKLEMLFAIRRSSKLDQPNFLPCLAVVEALVVAIVFLLSMKNTILSPMCGHGVWHYFFLTDALAAEAVAASTKLTPVTWGTVGAAVRVAAAVTVKGSPEAL